MKIPMPLRVPELAPSLGRLIVPRHLEPLWVPLDDVREELATVVLELGGEARRAAAEEDRDAALAALSRATWLGAWERAVRRAAERVTTALDQTIDVTAARLRMAARRRRRLFLSIAERRAVAARLGTGGAPFVAALDALDGAARGARDASVLDHAAHEAWQEALRTAARRLEAAWLALEQQVAAERGRWEPELAEIERWRPSLVPVVLWWLPVAAVLVWLGLVLGGYLPAPQWLAARLGF